MYIEMYVKYMYAYIMHYKSIYPSQDSLSGKCQTLNPPTAADGRTCTFQVLLSKSRQGLSTSGHAMSCKNVVSRTKSMLLTQRNMLPMPTSIVLLKVSVSNSWRNTRDFAPQKPDGGVFFLKNKGGAITTKLTKR